MNLKSKVKLFLGVFVLLIMLLSIKASAVSISISTSASSVAPGESFTATITGTDATGRVDISVENGTASGSSVWVENDAQSITVTAGSSGTVSISASGELSNSDGTSDETVTASASVSIAADTGNTDTPSEPSEPVVTAPVLSNLGINPYDFTGFRSGTTSYSVTVPNDCTSVTIYATSNNGTVTGTGAVTLREGTNRYTVTVSNSAGSKDYTLSIIRRTAEEEIVPDVTEDETENDSEGIGLTGLRVTNYNFEEEFQTGVYEYTVKIEKGLTESELEDIKNSITAITNDENVYVEIQTNLNEDGSAVVTLIVKDDEREYSTYTINFVIDETLAEDEETSEIAGTTRTNNSRGRNCC